MRCHIRLLHYSPLHLTVYVLVLLLASMGLISCSDSKLTQPGHTNPFDDWHPDPNSDPFNLQAVAGSQSIQLSWQNPEGPGISEYEIFRQVDEVGEFNYIRKQPATVTVLTDVDIEASHYYAYKIVAYNSAGHCIPDDRVPTVSVRANPVMVLAEGAGMSATPLVDLRIESYLATEMKVSELPGAQVFWQDFNQLSTWDFEESNVHLDGDSLRLYLKLRYSDGSESSEVSSLAILDLEPPIAFFTIIYGSRGRIYFDASTSHDANYTCATEQLKARWDFDGDGNWDTDFENDFTVYSDYWPGESTIRVQIRDIVGHENEYSQAITVPNRLPTEPVNPSPVDGDANATPLTDLSWSSSIDPDGAEVLYDVYFSYIGEPLVHVATVIEAVLDLGSIRELSRIEWESQYQWQVIARDPHGGEIASDIWTFFIGSHVPRLPVIKIHAGEFTMGDGESQCGLYQRSVTLTEDFYLGRTEITNAQYIEMLQWALDENDPPLIEVTSENMVRSKMGSTRYLLDLGNSWNSIRFRSGWFRIPDDYRDHPVANLSWYGAACFCDWLSMSEGLLPAYENIGLWLCNGGDPYGAEGYRLPTDAEWEYAARYNDDRIYPWGNEEPTPALANYRSDDNHLAPVGSYPPAPADLLLLDMAGNVREWCNDLWTCNLSVLAVVNPVGGIDGDHRVARGGYWQGTAEHLRCAQRGHGNQRGFGQYTGFRIAKSISP
jgi:formylglycine-generating enzyme required for sulfatase activity